MNDPESIAAKEVGASRALQLRLLPPHRPLVERLGVEFFRRIPAKPGVYLMTGDEDRLLYVGKAKNLRARLASYRHLQPERASRKTLRLVGLVRSVTWELCDSPEAALLRENELLRRHKPRFNVMNVRPEHYLFLGVRVHEGHLEIRLTRTPTRFSGETLHGAFKSMGRIRGAMPALLRLLWISTYPGSSVFGFPREWMGERCPSVLRISDADLGARHAEEIAAALRSFLQGDESPLPAWLEEAATGAAAGGRPAEQLAAADLEQFREFQKFGPARNHRLRTHLAYPHDSIAQHHLDDLLVLEAAGAQLLEPVNDPGLDARHHPHEVGGCIPQGGDATAARPADSAELLLLEQTQS